MKLRFACLSFGEGQSKYFRKIWVTIATKELRLHLRWENAAFYTSNFT
jgi:hypothetical protein